jgi:hypothetical protein
MKQKSTSLSVFVLIMGFTIMLSGCTNQIADVQTNNDDANGITPTQALCDELAVKLDAQITDTNNPPGRFIISSLGENVGEVGGTLRDIKNNGLDRNYNSYVLTFQGKESNSKGELYLLTTSNETLPYIAGKFYSFDLQNINKYSAATSGMFIDNELNKLTQIDCKVQ